MRAPIRTCWYRRRSRMGGAQYSDDDAPAIFIYIYLAVVPGDKPLHKYQGVYHENTEQTRRRYDQTPTDHTTHLWPHPYPLPPTHLYAPHLLYHQWSVNNQALLPPGQRCRPHGMVSVQVCGRSEMPSEGIGHPS